MFSRNQPARSPDASGGGAPIDFTRDAYAALVQVAHKPPPGVPHAAAIDICATNFSNNMVPALKRGQVSIELALKYLQLTNPFSGNNVFAETGPLPHLVPHVAEHIIERVRAGAAISVRALASLRGYVASPHDIGVDASMAAFNALIAGCSRCFTISTPHQVEPPSAPDPVAEVSLLGPELNWVATKHPAPVAEVVARIDGVFVEPVLARGIDAIMKDLADPNANIPPEVRHVAKIALARRAG